MHYVSTSVCLCVFVKSDKKNIPDFNFIPESKSLFQVSAHSEAAAAADTHQQSAEQQSVLSLQLQQV